MIRQQAARLAAPLVMWGEHFDAYEQRGRLVVQSEDELLDLPLPVLIGRHQVVNAGTAVAAALQLGRRLPALALDEWAIEAGLTSARWPARMQRLDAGPLPSLLKPGAELWLDGGHNPAAGRALAQTLADLEERCPQAAASHRRHDGLEGIGGLPVGVPRACAPRRRRCRSRARTRHRMRLRCWRRPRAASGSRPSGPTASRAP